MTRATLKCKKFSCQKEKSWGPPNVLPPFTKNETLEGAIKERCVATNRPGIPLANRRPGRLNTLELDVWGLRIFGEGSVEQRVILESDNICNCFKGQFCDLAHRLLKGEARSSKPTTFSECWVRKDSMGSSPEIFFRWQFLVTERFTQKITFLRIYVSRQ